MILKKSKQINHIFFITKEPYTKHQLIAFCDRFTKGNLTEVDILTTQGYCSVYTDSDVHKKLTKVDKPPFNPLEEVDVVPIDGGEEIGMMVVVCRPSERLN